MPSPPKGAPLVGLYYQADHPKHESKIAHPVDLDHAIVLLRQDVKSGYTGFRIELAEPFKVTP